MTDNYERMNIDGKNYVLVPEELWSEDSHDTRTEPNPAWLDYVLADDARINADIGLYSNLLLPLVQGVGQGFVVGVVGLEFGAIGVNLAKNFTHR